MIISVTPRIIQNEFRRLSPEAQERVIEAIKLRRMACRFIGKKYSVTLVKALKVS